MDGTVGHEPGHEASAFHTLAQPHSDLGPWTQPGSDPWQRASASAAPPVDWSASPAGTAYDEPSWNHGQMQNRPAYDALQKADSGADSDARSSVGDLDYNEQDLQGLSPAELDEHLFWLYQHAKSRWRKHMHKPVRHVRRLFKRRPNGKGKGGKGKAKGSSRFSFLADMTDEEVEHTFFGEGLRNGNGKSCTSGKERNESEIPVARTDR